MIMLKTTRVGRYRGKEPAGLGHWLSLACLAVPMVLVQVGHAATPACANMTLRLFDYLPRPSVFLEPKEPAAHDITQVQIFVDGSRLMSSPFWKITYRILPSAASAGAVTEETYLNAADNSPVLEISLERDRDGRVFREILRDPRLANQKASEPQNRIKGWYQYSRDYLGRIIEIIYHANSGADGQWFTEDDGLTSRVEVTYENSDSTPKEATILYDRSGKVPVQFDYDDEGRLVGGTRQCYWPTYFLVAGGVCREVPERLFVILLGSHGGPWLPYPGGRRSIRPPGPR